jgi:hypothetical protein
VSRPNTSTVHLSDEQIAEFQALYFKQFNTRLSKDEALRQGLALLQLIKALA